MTGAGGITADQAARAVIAACNLLGQEPSKAFEPGQRGRKGSGRLARTLAAHGVRARLGLAPVVLARVFRITPQELAPSLALKHAFTTDHYLAISEALGPIVLESPEAHEAAPAKRAGPSERPAKGRGATPPSHAQRLKAGEAAAGGPPLTLAHDEALVSACLAQGGFPRSVSTAVGTVWAGPDGAPWSGSTRKRKGGAKA